MNPFDLRGPDFLAFYLGLALVAGLLFALWRRISDQTGRPREIPSDPYLLAHLRGGRVEALRTALFMFLAEGAATREGHLVTAATKAPPRPLAPLETEVWAGIQSPYTLDGLLREGVGVAACTGLQARLEGLGYRRSDSQTGIDRGVALLLTAVVLVVAIVKIELALSRGHKNVGLLVALAFFVGLIGFRHRPSAVTSRGRRALEAVQGLLAGARARLQQDTGIPRPEELGMVMAAYGVGVFTAVDIPFLPAVGVSPFGQLRGGGVSSGGGSCGSGGASCGSSCGGGCGGGGCGGCGS